MSEVVDSSAFQVLGVPWDDQRAIELRAAMDTEMGERYAGRSIPPPPAPPLPSTRAPPSSS